MSIDQIKHIKPKTKIKTPPWISAVLALISSVALLFLLLTSMEQAFDFVEDFFEQTPNSTWFFQIPIPIICTFLVYYFAQHSQKRSLNTLIFMSSATFTGIVGMAIYIIIPDYFIAIYHEKADFYYLLVITAISLSVGILSLFVTKFIIRKRSLQKGSLTGK